MATFKKKKKAANAHTRAAEKSKSFKKYIDWLPK